MTPAQLLYLLIVTTPLWGYLIVKNRIVNPTWCGWLIAICFILSIYFFIEAGPLMLMFLYITSTFWALKIVVANNQLTRAHQLNFIQWCVFCYAWFGMNPSPFNSFPNRPLQDYFSHIKKGISRCILGVVLIYCSYWFFMKFVPDHRFDYLEYTFYLVGLSLILHFGILNINTGLLRSAGINAGVLFNNPLKSKTLREFWSKRWNLAFIELTTIAVLRPLKKRFGYDIAFWISYVFSGLLHELAISLPVKSGFGKPFLYFIIQAILIVVIEKHIITPKTSSTLRLIWLIVCLFTPIFILFHHQFIVQIVLVVADFIVKSLPSLS